MKKKKRAVILLLCVGVLALLLQRLNVKEEKLVTKEELQDCEAVLSAREVPGSVRSAMSDGQKYFLAQNIELGATYESSKVCEIKPQETDEKKNENLKVTCYVFSVASEEKQIFVVIDSPKGWGMNGDVCRIANESGWKIVTDISMSVFTETQAGVQKGSTYYPYKANPERNRIGKMIYEFRMPENKLGAGRGTGYMGGIMTYAKQDSSQDEVWTIDFYYEHNGQVIYKDIIEIQ